MVSPIELRSSVAIFRTDINKLVNGRHIGYTISVINICDDDGKILLENPSLNFVDVKEKLSTNLVNKLNPTTFDSTKSRWNHTYYVINPTPLSSGYKF